VNLRLVSAAIVLVLSGIMLGADVYESVMLDRPGGRMGRGKLCSYRPDFDRRYFGHDFDDPHRTRDRSRTPVVLMRVLRRY